MRRRDTQVDPLDVIGAPTGITWFLRFLKMTIITLNEDPPGLLIGGRGP